MRRLLFAGCRPRLSRFVVCLALLLSGLACLAHAQPQPKAKRPRGQTPSPAAQNEAGGADRLVRRTWQVEGVEREALVALPATPSIFPAPLVFAFHGHGGSMQKAASMFHLQQLWPEAVVVYMQGLNTPAKLVDPEGKKTGWQHANGELGNRDLKFFDAVLTSLRSEYPIDDHQIYGTGHSNGGMFTYLLWETRGELFAAVAPSAAAGPDPEWNQRVQKLTPKPVLHLAGRKDELVKFAWQKRTIEQLRKLNGCGPDGTPWAPLCTLYNSPTGTPVVTLIHPGAHNFPQQAPELFVRFFREHRKP